jgi:anti-sigma regulatory factor (Ser/Thr protein kinase)
MRAALKRKMLIVADAASCAAVTRSQLSEILTDWGCADDLIDDARLVATELVTNGMLHGGGCTSLAAIFDGQVLRLEVGDRGGALPQEHHYDDEAATGRGLGLIAAISSSWGWEIQVAGKIVWAEIGAPPEVPKTDPLPSAPRAVPTGGPDDVLVCFRHVSVADYLSLQEHNDALYRDIDLVLIGSDEGLTSKVPEELLRLVQEMRSRFGPPSSAHRRAVEVAAAAGRTTVDLEEWVSTSMAETSEEYVRLLERIEAYAGRDYLLIARPSKAVVMLRRWFAEQVAGQTKGPACVWS